MRHSNVFNVCKVTSIAAVSALEVAHVQIIKKKTVFEFISAPRMDTLLHIFSMDNGYVH